MISAYKLMAKEAYEEAHADYSRIKMQPFWNSVWQAQRPYQKTVFAETFNWWSWKQQEEIL